MEKEVLSKTIMELQEQFSHISALIKEAKQRAFQAVNHELVSLYWQVGEYVSQQVASKVWVSQP